MKDVYFNIAINTDYKDFKSVMCLNKDFHGIFHQDYFWNQKCMNDYTDFNTFTSGRKKTWKRLYIYNYLSQLNYEKLKNIKMLDDYFWKDKLNHDYPGLTILTDHLNKFKYDIIYDEVYQVNKIYPVMNYPLTLDDLNVIYNNHIPILKSSSAEDFIDTFRLLNHYGAEMIKNNKQIPLYNYGEDFPNAYELRIKKLFRDNLLEIIQHLNIGDSLTIYIYDYNPSINVQLIRFENKYKLIHRKSFSHGL